MRSSSSSGKSESEARARARRSSKVCAVVYACRWRDQVMVVVEREIGRDSGIDEVRYRPFCIDHTQGCSMPIPMFLPFYFTELPIVNDGLLTTSVLVRMSLFSRARLHASMRNSPLPTMPPPWACDCPGLTGEKGRAVHVRMRKRQDIAGAELAGNVRVRRARVDCEAA